MPDPGNSLLFDPLSEREVEILRLLAGSLTNREIGQELFISLETVKWYNKQIYGKLGVGSRTQATAKAREIGLFDERREEKTLIAGLPKHNLPAQITTFVGRERELAELEQLLGTARLITLTGPGGTGKTRLGLQLAGETIRNYPDGAYFVPLGVANDPSLVPYTIARTLGLVESPDKPLGVLLQHHLSSKEMLLILDNFEHVLVVAPLVTELLSAASGLTVVTTSREALRLNGEHEYPVPPLGLPDPASAAVMFDLTASESVTLFKQRAQAVQPSFRLAEENVKAVADICIRLDGLPLAIELAAARVKLFAPQQLLERLDSRLQVLTRGARDLPARQQTLRSAIDWSYNLLDKAEQALFARLGVFQAGWTIDAVEAVCGPGLPVDVLDGLDSLLNKSLLYQEEKSGGEPRFVMLETIHEYARERLAVSGEEYQMRDRHLGYFLSLAEEMQPGYRGHHQLLLLSRTEAEMGNLRSAFNWAIENEDIEAGARLVVALEYFLYYKDHLAQGYRWINHLLGRLDDIAPDFQVKFLIAAGKLASANDDLIQSTQFCQRALAMAREQGDRENEGWALIYLAASFINRPEKYEEAIGSCEAGLAIFRELENKPGLAQGLNIMGELARMAGDYSRAREVYETCLAICIETGEIIRQFMMLVCLSFVAYHEGNYERARELSAANTKRMYEIKAKQFALSGLASLAGPLGKLGQPEKATRLLGASRALMAEMGVDYHMGDQHEIARYTESVRAQLDGATFEAAWAEGQAMTLDQAIEYALEGDGAQI